MRVRDYAVGVALVLSLGASLGCEDVGKKSASEALSHLDFVRKAGKQDVAQVRNGLPAGAKLLVKLFQTAGAEVPGAEASREALERARDKVQDLRFAKSTFFAVLTKEGRVVRNDREQDLMAGKDFFRAFPALGQASDKAYLETSGSMPEASGVKGRPDAQWVASAKILDGAATLGYYVTGWSYSSYAYRLENGLRSELLSGAHEGQKIPLLYVFVVIDHDVYGTPVSPAVNREAVAKKDLLGQLEGDKPLSMVLEIDQRTFGLAAGRLSEFGDKGALVVLRSET